MASVSENVSRRRTRHQMKQLTASGGELSGGEQSREDQSGEELMQEFDRRAERQKESAGEVAKVCLDQKMI